MSRISRFYTFLPLIRAPIRNRDRKNQRFFSHATKLSWPATTMKHRSMVVLVQLERADVHRIIRRKAALIGSAALISRARSGPS
jgi:hypothetical protein